MILRQSAKTPFVILIFKKAFSKYTDETENDKLVCGFTFQKLFKKHTDIDHTWLHQAGWCKVVQMSLYQSESGQCPGNLPGISWNVLAYTVIPRGPSQWFKTFTASNRTANSEAQLWIIH